ncbi:hypothetical protein [Rheinheimera sp. EpRS3]|uniref:hypothetical protein n=1 Tax=Rheinheimera sp. EpRS3 TaxID=1712383 RepID=UPI000746F14C|nr:hypothetical protein [Rheinheimera sp. EpRS3]KUM55031.1 hypothetical protein AR688_17465 [Rheinheimera sp. EpRS3]
MELNRQNKDVDNNRYSGARSSGCNTWQAHYALPAKANLFLLVLQIRRSLWAGFFMSAIVVLMAAA